MARFVDDVDSVQDLLVRVIAPFAIAIIVGVGTVMLEWVLLPAAGAIVAVALLLDYLDLIEALERQVKSLQAHLPAHVQQPRREFLAMPPGERHGRRVDFGGVASGESLTDASRVTGSSVAVGA